MKLTKKIAYVLSSLFAGIFMMMPAVAMAQGAPLPACGPGVSPGTPPTCTPAAGGNVDEICKGVEFTGGSNCSNPADAEKTVSDTIKKAIDIISIVVGVISVIMIIVGGLQYITSSGDSAKVNTAKNTILYAVIGLVVVALAQVIVRFVLGRVK